VILLENNRWGRRGNSCELVVVALEDFSFTIIDYGGGLSVFSQRVSAFFGWFNG